MLIYFVVSGVLLIKISKNQQIQSKSLITIQLLFLLLAGLFDTVRNIWMMCREEVMIKEDTPFMLRAISTTSECLFYCQHWEFTVQYLKCARMFEFPFKEQTEEVIAES